MNLNVTIIIQILAFFGVVWFTMKNIWPNILGAMEEREKKIANGLAAGDRAEKELNQAKAKVDTLIIEAKEQASHIKDQATQMATKIKDEARQQVSALAIAGTEQLLSKEVDASKHADLLDDLIKEI